MRFLTTEQVVRLHDEIVARSGGETGILNISQLQSALERCQHGPFFEPPDLALRAGLLLRGIAQDHPFVDGNKRTAFGAADVFLRLNGYFLEAQTPQITSFMLSVAMARLDLDLMVAWLAHHTQPLSPEETQP